MPVRIELRSPRIALPDDPEAVFQQLYDLGVTDGLPVIPPTAARVERFVAAAGRAAETLIAEMPPKSGLATVEKIATNAVMAGCRPEYMPLLLAAVEAVCEPAFNLHGIQATTNPVAPLIVVNGPVRQQLDLNCGRNALGPGRRANATLGRALRLMMLNIGGGVPGEVDKATLGMPGKYTLCLGELEEESPWEPLHAERGFQREASAVTVIGVQGTHNLLPVWKKAQSIFLGIGNGMAALATNNFVLGGGNPVLILNPGHAWLLADQGYSKQQLKEQLFEHAKVPLSAWPDEPLAIQTERYRNVVGEWTTPTKRPEDILIVVAGGPEAYHVTYCASFGDTWAVTKPVPEPERQERAGPTPPRRSQG